jgi:hypothetical protein
MDSDSFHLHEYLEMINEEFGVVNTNEDINENMYDIENIEFIDSNDLDESHFLFCKTNQNENKEEEDNHKEEEETTYEEEETTYEEKEEEKEDEEEYIEEYEIKNVNYGIEEKGYLHLQNVYPKEIVDRFQYELQNFLNQEGIYSHLQKRQDVPLQHYFVNNTYGALQNYQQLQHYYVPVIDNRGTYNRSIDVGVIDIYNVDRLFPQIKNYFDVSVMLSILYKTTGIQWKLSRTNLQLYSNVSNPNGFHYDCGYEKHIKFTIYLTDIKDEFSGPYMYIEGTHKNKKGIKSHQTKSFLGEKGDVIISYQNGFHRRGAQRVASTNVFLTFHFTTKSEKDRFFPFSMIPLF